MLPSFSFWMICVGSCVTQWAEGQHDVFWALITLIIVMCWSTPTKSTLPRFAAEHFHLKRWSRIRSVFFWIIGKCSFSVRCCVYVPGLHVTAVRAYIQGRPIDFFYFFLPPSITYLYGCLTCDSEHPSARGSRGHYWLSVCVCDAGQKGKCFDCVLFSRAGLIDRAGRWCTWSYTEDFLLGGF